MLRTLFAVAIAGLVFAAVSAWIVRSLINVKRHLPFKQW